MVVGVVVYRSTAVFRVLLGVCGLVRKTNKGSSRVLGMVSKAFQTGLDHFVKEKPSGVWFYTESLKVPAEGTNLMTS